MDAQPGPGLAAEGSGLAGDLELQVQRIVESPVLRNSPVLQSFLRFVTDRALNGREAEINEYTIATQVFSRNSDFDPAADTIVRTQAYRLRSKLQQYYGTVGIGDPIVIEIPKGHYVPVFRRNEPVPEMPAALESGELPSAPPVGSRRWWRIALLGPAVVAVFFLGWFAGSRNKTATPARPAKAAQPTPVEALWLSFLETDRQPIVAFTNGQFLGTDTADLLRFSGGPVADRGTPMKNPPGGSGRTGRLYYEDDYTGVGEILAAVAISNTLLPLTGPLPFKRSRLVTAYDLHHHNLIFLGSPGVNPILNDLPQPQNFVFRPAPAPPVLWRSQLENVQPEAGELRFYQVERDPATGVLRADYATVTLFPGIAPGRKILVLAGLTTSGTEAAAESITTLHGVTELAGKLGVANPSDPEKWPEAFQTLLRVELSRGLDVIQSRSVASRVTRWKK
jgi:hypothetical protein